MRNKKKANHYGMPFFCSNSITQALYKTNTNIIKNNAVLGFNRLYLYFDIP
jgi:hypothetical protein